MLLMRLRLILLLTDKCSCSNIKEADISSSKGQEKFLTGRRSQIIQPETGLIITTEIRIIITPNPPAAIIITGDNGDKF